MENKMRKKGCDMYSSKSVSSVTAQQSVLHFLGPSNQGREDRNFPILQEETGQKTQKLGWRETEDCCPINMLSKSGSFSTKILQSCDGKMEMAGKQEGWQSCSSHSHQTRSHPPTPRPSSRLEPVSCIFQDTGHSNRLWS